MFRAELLKLTEGKVDHFLYAGGTYTCTYTCIYC